MNIPPGVSDEAADAVVELAFLALPSMDAEELTAQELRRAQAEERERQTGQLRPSVQ
jgi:hypothetical protein